MQQPSTTPVSPEGRVSPERRKIFRLGIAVVAVCLVYTGAWHLAATALESRIERIFEQQNPFGAAVECDNRTLSGFPFRIGLFCDKLSVNDVNNGVSASFGGFRSAAQVYAPGHIVWELDGPGEIRSADGLSATLEWDELRSSVVTGLANLKRSSIESTALRAIVNPGRGLPAFELRAPTSEMHIRANGADLDYAAIYRDVELSLRDGGLALPKFSASLDLTLAERARLLDYGGGDRSWRGTSGELRRFAIEIGAGQVLTVNGPVSINDEGLLSGRLRVEIEGINGFADALKTLMPDAAGAIEQGARLLTALASGDQNVSTDIRIRDGVITLGLFPIGKIPPL